MERDLYGYLNDGSTPPPFFEKHTLEETSGDGYWMSAVDITGNGKLDLITSGLAEGKVCWYENPTWEKRLIAEFDQPVAIDAADIAGRGRNDLVISHDFGGCAFNCGPNDGKVSWLENPGNFEANTPWTKRHIADLVATHRVKLGSYTGPGRMELFGIPVVGALPYGKGVLMPIELTLFEKPEDVFNQPWNRRVVDSDNFALVHDVLSDQFSGDGVGDTDSLLVSSKEGITWYYYDFELNAFKSFRISEGDRTYMESGFTGTSNAVPGRLGDDPYAFIATIDPFHGSTVALLTRKQGSTLTDGVWERRVLDTFGSFSPKHQGTGHHIVVADFDNDGEDEFLVGLRGPMPNQGVYYYKIIDLEQGLIERWRVSTVSTSMIAVGDFSGDGTLDFATTSYYTPGFFLCDKPQVAIYYNRFAQNRK